MAKGNLFKTLFSSSTDNTFIQFFRYCFVGGAAFVVDYGTLFLLTESVDIHYLISATIAFILGLATNYCLSTLWVFSKHTIQNRWGELLIFCIIGIIGLGFNEGIMYVCTDICELHYMLSKVISTIIVFFWNFFARKFILFNTKS